MEAGENEKEIDFGFGLKQAKNGLVLAEGEKIVDCFDYDCYMTYDRRNKKMKTETTVLLTNKRFDARRFAYRVPFGGSGCCGRGSSHRLCKVQGVLRHNGLHKGSSGRAVQGYVRKQGGRFFIRSFAEKR